MNRKQLTYFLTACRTRNIQAAADEGLLRDLVERKNWIAVTYDFSARDHCGPNTVLRWLEGEEYGQTIFLARRLGSAPTRAARRFREFLLSWIQTHPAHSGEQSEE